MCSIPFAHQAVFCSPANSLARGLRGKNVIGPAVVVEYRAMRHPSFEGKRPRSVGIGPLVSQRPYELMPKSRTPRFCAYSAKHGAKYAFEVVLTLLIEPSENAPLMRVVRLLSYWADRPTQMRAVPPASLLTRYELALVLAPPLAKCWYWKLFELFSALFQPPDVLVTPNIS